MAVMMLIQPLGGYTKGIPIASTALPVPHGAKEVHLVVVVPPEIALDPDFRAQLTLRYSTDGGITWLPGGGSTSAGVPVGEAFTSGHEQGFEPGNLPSNLDRNFVFVQEDSGGVKIGPTLGSSRPVDLNVLVRGQITITGGNGNSPACPAALVAIAKDENNADIDWETNLRIQVAD